MESLIITKKVRKPNEKQTEELLKLEPQVTKIEREEETWGDRLIIHLKDFKPESPTTKKGEKYAVADYAIINMKRKGKRKTETKLEVDGITPNMHSHAKTGGREICYGNLNTQAIKAGIAGDRYTAIKTLIQLLNQYNYSETRPEDAMTRYLNQALIHAKLKGRKEEQEKIRKSMEEEEVKELDIETVRRTENHFHDSIRRP